MGLRHQVQTDAQMHTDLRIPGMQRLQVGMCTHVSNQVKADTEMYTLLVSSCLVGQHMIHTLLKVMMVSSDPLMCEYLGSCFVPC